MKRSAHGIGKNNCRQTGIILDVHQVADTWADATLSPEEFTAVTI
jgi:hypothetical protein